MLSHCFIDLRIAPTKGGCPLYTDGMDLKLVGRTEVQVLVLEDANGQLVAVSSNRYQLRRMRPSGA